MSIISIQFSWTSNINHDLASLRAHLLSFELQFSCQGKMIHLIYLFTGKTLFIWLQFLSEHIVDLVMLVFVWSFPQHITWLLHLLLLSGVKHSSYPFFPLNMCQAHMWLMRRTTSSTSIWTQKRSYYSNLGEEEWRRKQQWVCYSYPLTMFQHPLDYLHIPCIFDAIYVYLGPEPGMVLNGHGYFNYKGGPSSQCTTCVMNCGHIELCIQL